MYYGTHYSGEVARSEEWNLLEGLLEALSFGYLQDENHIMLFRHRKTKPFTPSYGA
jgi:hypothetical protein